VVGPGREHTTEPAATAGATTANGAAEPTEQGVRAQVTQWIEENFDPEQSLHTWLGKLADSGWAQPSWPRQWYGQGLPADLAATAWAEFNKAGAPGPPAGLAVMLAAPTIMTHGTDELKERFVRNILTGDEAWCQLFSEPGAGSDLAGLQTRARLDGDEYIIDGQKVWTSGGLTADYGMLLARTDPDVPKHQGISYFAFNMDQPGVEVRPLIQMTGESGFSEVFMTGARVPANHLIGQLNGGWTVALATLNFERTGLGAGAGAGFRLSTPGGKRAMKQLRETSVGEYVKAVRARARSFGTNSSAMIGGSVSALVTLARELGHEQDSAVRQEIVRAHTLAAVNGWNGQRARAALQAGGRPGPEASLGKLMASRIARQWRDTASLVAGERGMLAGDDGPLNGAVAIQLLATPAPAIYGGSDQIQHNIIGERVLGLPREPDMSKNVPFRQLKVGTQKADPGEAAR
jgi:alkylation response protein AidB-like acyl-CoA dehydrogenase